MYIYQSGISLAMISLTQIESTMKVYIFFVKDSNLRARINNSCIEKTLSLVISQHSKDVITLKDDKSML